MKNQPHTHSVVSLGRYLTITCVYDKKLPAVHALDDENWERTEGKYGTAVRGKKTNKTFSDNCVAVMEYKVQC